MKRILPLALLAFVLCGILAGCGKKEINFVYYSDSVVKTLDPQLAATSTELSTVKHLFSGLYRLTENGEAIPDNALETSVSADGLTYTFTLNDKNAFSDGKDHTIPVTAADYVFGLQRVLTPSTGSPYAKNFFCIQGAQMVFLQDADPSLLGVRALSDTVLEITLETPDSGLPAKLAGSGAMPCNRNFFEEAAGAYGLSGKTILGNGAYSLSGWSESSGITLKRIDPTKGQITRVRFIPEDGEKTAADRLLEELQDVALVTDAAEIEQLTAKGFQHTTFENSTCSLLFNCSDHNFSNLSVRQALAASAIDSASSFNEYPSLLPASGLIPGNVTLLGNSYREQTGAVLPALAPAQRYATYQLGLSELGTAKLSGITVLLPDSEPYLSLYRAINQNWQREFGAFFSIEALPLNELYERLAAGDYTIAMVPYAVTENDPAALLNPFRTTSPDNLTRFSDAEYDIILSLALRASGQTQLTQYQTAEQCLLQKAPLVPLKFETCDFFISPSLDGVVVDPFGPVIDLTNATSR
ncbi:MAG: peptide ABC transporter substrate-binding protein [Pygmaiobacter sp.]